MQQREGWPHEQHIEGPYKPKKQWHVDARLVSNLELEQRGVASIEYSATQCQQIPNQRCWDGVSVGIMSSELIRVRYKHDARKTVFIAVCQSSACSLFQSTQALYLKHTDITLTTLSFSTLNIAPMPSVKSPDMDDRMVLLATLVYAKLALVV